MDHLTLFEMLHGLRFAVCLALVILFGQYLILNAGMLPKIGWKVERIQAAVAFFVYCLGEAAWRGLVWVNHGDSVEHFSWYLCFMAAGSVSLFGAVCCLRVMLPNQWKWPTWIVLSSIAVVIGVASLFI